MRSMNPKHDTPCEARLIYQVYLRSLNFRLRHRSVTSPKCVAVIKRYQRQTAMNREAHPTDAGLKPQAGIVALFREDEFLGLAVNAVAKGKSGKFHAQPLGPQTGGERVLQAPGCARLHREVIVGRQT